MLTKVKYKRWKGYSGPHISGTVNFKLKENSTHWERVLWLTTYVESGGRFGAITMYDGTSVTAGITQCILTYPRELAHEDNNPEDDQGPLCEMLKYIKEDAPELLVKLEEEFLECGWMLGDGNLRSINVDDTWGNLINGRVIREELTPNQGKVPSFGTDWQNAKGWALLFHNIFADPKSFDSQIRFGIEHAHKIATRKPKFLRGDTIEGLVYQGNCKDTKLFNKNDPLDLAMAILFSNAVNAPAMAFRKLREAFNIFAGRNNKRPNWQNPTDRRSFAKGLIRVLGNANYAGWNFKIPTGRYQRTRKGAKKVWPKEMFEGQNAVMPRWL